MLIAVELIMLIDAILSLQSWRSKWAEVSARDGILGDGVKL